MRSSIRRKRIEFKQWLEARVRERVTSTGLVFLLALALTGFAAFASANNLLFLLLAAMLATLLVSSFVSRIGIAGLELDIQLPDHIAAKRPVAAKVVLRNEKSWMPSFSIRLVGVEDSVFTTDLYFPVIPGGGLDRDNSGSPVRTPRPANRGQLSILIEIPVRIRGTPGAGHDEAGCAGVPRP
ncbi:MAG: hypothetical protein QM757_11750 [Paludibaculum sp.]